MATDNRRRTDTYGHEGGHHHRDVSGGWLRPAVFGAMDGLVTNADFHSANRPPV
jgi:vacuolar iron transporter family protein